MEKDSEDGQGPTQCSRADDDDNNDDEDGDDDDDDDMCRKVKT